MSVLVSVLPFASVVSVVTVPLAVSVTFTVSITFPFSSLLTVVVTVEPSDLTSVVVSEPSLFVTVLVSVTVTELELPSSSSFLQETNAVQVNSITIRLTNKPFPKFCLKTLIILFLLKKLRVSGEPRTARITVRESNA